MGARLERKAEAIPAEAVAFGELDAGPEFIDPQEALIRLQEFDPLEVDELAKLEIYAFANCANRMEYHASAQVDGRRVPWIESFGNQYDLVARLGMLAPRAAQWGHLLDQHSLIEIEKHQQAGYQKKPRGGSAPYSGVGEAARERTPRLFFYINRGVPVD